MLKNNHGDKGQLMVNIPAYINHYVSYGNYINGYVNYGRLGREV